MFFGGNQDDSPISRVEMGQVPLAENNGQGGGCEGILPFVNLHSDNNDSSQDSATETGQLHQLYLQIRPETRRQIAFRKKLNEKYNGNEKGLEEVLKLSKKLPNDPLNIKDDDDDPPIDTILLLVFYALSKLGQLLMLGQGDNVNEDVDEDDLNWGMAGDTFGFLGNINLLAVDYSTEDFSYYDRVVTLSALLFTSQFIVFYELHNTSDDNLTVAQLEDYYRHDIIHHIRQALKRVLYHFMKLVRFLLNLMTYILRIFLNCFRSSDNQVHHYNNHNSENAGLETTFIAFFISVIVIIVCLVLVLDDNEEYADMGLGLVLICVTLPCIIIFIKYQLKKWLKESCFDYYEDDERATRFTERYGIYKYTILVFIWLLLSIPLISGCMTLISKWSDQNNQIRAGVIVYSILCLTFAGMNATSMYFLVKKAAKMRIDAEEEEDDKMMDAVIQYVTPDPCKSFNIGSKVNDCVAQNAIFCLHEDIQVTVRPRQEGESEAQYRVNIAEELKERRLNDVVLSAFLSGFAVDTSYFKFIQLGENLLFSGCTIFADDAAQALLSTLLVTIFFTILTLFRMPYDNGEAYFVDISSRLQTIITICLGTNPNPNPDPIPIPMPIPIPNPNPYSEGMGIEAGTVDVTLGEVIILAVTCLLFIFLIRYGINVTKIIREAFEKTKNLLVAPDMKTDDEIKRYLDNTDIVSIMAPRDKLERLARCTDADYILKKLELWDVSPNEMVNFIQSELREGGILTRNGTEAKGAENDMSDVFTRTVKRRYKQRLITRRMCLRALKEMNYGAAEIMFYADRYVCTVVEEEKMDEIQTQSSDDIESTGPTRFDLSIGTRVFFLDVDGETVLRLPGTIKHVNLGYTYNVELDDGTFLRGLRRGLELEKADDLYSDGKETNNMPVRKVFELTDNDFHLAKYGSLEIMKARALLGLTRLNRVDGVLPAMADSWTKANMFLKANVWQPAVNLVTADYKENDDVLVFVEHLALWLPCQIVGRADVEGRYKVKLSKDYTTKLADSFRVGCSNDKYKGTNKEFNDMPHIRNKLVVSVPSHYIKPVAVGDSCFPYQDNALRWLKGLNPEVAAKCDTECTALCVEEFAADGVSEVEWYGSNGWGIGKVSAVHKYSNGSLKAYTIQYTDINNNKRSIDVSPACVRKVLKTISLFGLVEIPKFWETIKIPGAECVECTESS